MTVLRNQRELKSLRETVESVKNASITNLINHMANPENTTGTSMMDEILNYALKTLRAEKALMNQKLIKEVSSAIAKMNGEFVGLDDKVNDKIEAAGCCIKIVSIAILKKQSMRKLLTGNC